jgi:hypothetical protein
MIEKDYIRKKNSNLRMTKNLQETALIIISSLIPTIDEVRPRNKQETRDFLGESDSDERSSE